MKKALVVSVTALIATLLSGCALLYPNWGTDVKPSTSASPSITPSTSESPSSSASPSVVLRNAEIKILSSEVDKTEGVLFVTAEVENFAEEGGTCTLTFVGGGKTFTATAKAEANVSRTSCYPLEIPLAGLPKGLATIQASYLSKSSKGESATQSINIQ